MANAKLIIDPSGLIARIVFTNSEQLPMPFETQKQLFSALPDLVFLKKITQLEAVEIFKTAIFSKNFPIDTIEEDHYAEAHTEHPLPFENMMIHLMFQKIFGDIEFNVSSEPLFKTCDCGKHGMIVFGIDEKNEVILSGNILSKQEGLLSITMYEDEVGLPSKYVEKLRREILSSSLPPKI